MPDLSALLAAVLADPDAAAPRLVYADALLDADDPRGELIALEHRLQAAADPALLDRRRELRRAHGATWWPELPTRFVRSRWGFARAVALRSEALGAAAALAAREPIRSIEVYGDELGPEGVQQLPGVPELVLRTANDEAVRALLESPLAESVASLDLSGSGVATLEPGVRLASCRRLALAATEVAVDDLLRWEHVGWLEELDLSATDTDPYELARLLGALPHLVSLRACNLDLGHFRAALERLAAALAAAPCLRRLDLVGCGLSEGDGDILMAAAPQVAVMTGPGPGPRVVDLVGETFELVPCGEGSWRVRVEGMPRATDCALTESDSVGSHRRSGADGERAALGLLADGLGCGFPRKLTQDGFELVARLLPRDNDVDASVALPDEPKPVSVVLEHYVD